MSGGPGPDQARASALRIVAALLTALLGAMILWAVALVSANDTVALGGLALGLLAITAGIYRGSEAARALGSILASLVALASGGFVLLFFGNLAGGGGDDIAPGPEFFAFLFGALLLALMVLGSLALGGRAEARAPRAALEPGSRLAASSASARARVPDEASPADERNAGEAGEPLSAAGRVVLLLAVIAVALAIVWVQPLRPSYRPEIVGVVKSIALDGAGMTVYTLADGRTVPAPAGSAAYFDYTQPTVGDLLIAVAGSDSHPWIARARPFVRGDIMPGCYVFGSGTGTDEGDSIRWSSNIIVPKAPGFHTSFGQPLQRYSGQFYLCLNESGEATSFQ